MQDQLSKAIQENVRAALAEDVGSGDLTAMLVPSDQVVGARVLTREPAVLCGRPWVDEVFRRLDTAITIDWLAADGDRVDANQVLLRLRGPARPILTGERTALNFLQTLSATATASRRFADAVSGAKAQVLDTRKTIPGLRQAQKYAVRCGGCVNHRFGLYDAVLIKENHIRSAGGLEAAVAAARQQARDVTVEVEIETLAQLGQALDAGADIVMLDNFNHADLREAVRRNGEHSHPAKLEASGNVSLETVSEIADTGVDYISTGAITKHVCAIDLSMQFDHR